MSVNIKQTLSDQTPTKAVRRSNAAAFALLATPEEPSLGSPHATVGAGPTGACPLRGGR